MSATKMDVREIVEPAAAVVAPRQDTPIDETADFAAPTLAQLDKLAGAEPMVALDGLVAGYATMEVLHQIDLRVARGQSLCLIGPNGAGKSTVLHSIYGIARVMHGRVAVAGRDATRMATNRRLRDLRIAYLLQDNSVFPDMTVEENLWMGGYLLPRREEARQRAEAVFSKYESLRRRRRQRAGALSGGERRLLEISRALIMDPQVLLVDEPSIGLEPRFIDMVFEILRELQHNEGKTIVMVEQNARKGLEFADLGYLLVAGRLVLAATGGELLEHPEVARQFLGG
ncbi:MAG TPA: ATP-binding cassette domain-containing protein [Burkholderiaceae bacterium]|nr:ATP-binding cassette domain-containing protein [Burkholderiaceae bacterium]